ncbi:MAG: betaine-aldehyde dehydrogenase [Porticoccaceae bacterium]|nr:MAG: betaine-aldehyde dehydrogenase [Porticoccaceae bacterium]
MALPTPAVPRLPRLAALVGDVPLAGGSGPEHRHVYPGNGRVTAVLSLAGAAEVDAAVAAARRALPAWRQLGGHRRRALLLALADRLAAQAAELAALSTLENGATAAAAAHLAPVAAERFRYYAGFADKVDGRLPQVWQADALDYVERVPYGVVGAIIPWNGPLFAAAMVLAPALAAGNTVVLKAPEIAPYTVMRLAELCLEAGFPPGVVNLVTGGAEVGEAMVAHEGIDKIQFVGSGATARKVLATAAATLKPCGLELGGKSAVLVFADADFERAVRAGLAGAVSANGQGCVNGTRILVERALYERYLEALTAAARAVPVGDPCDPATALGPVISEAALARILGIVERAQGEEARLVAGGCRLGGELAEGFFLPVTVLADVAPESRLAQEEVFGPVLAVLPFADEEEAVAIANGTDYGLGAYIHTRDLARAHRLASRMEAGMVQVNAAGEGMQPFAPFGGMKKSGFGRLGGAEGLAEFLQTRNVWVGLH